MNDLQIIEYKGIRVLTSQQIADAYESDPNTLNKNFNRNRDRYIEGKHYMCLQGNELKEFRAKGQIDVLPNVNKLYLWTEKGALLHAKSLNTDKAWEVYDRLVENYFRVRSAVNSALSPELQMLQGLLSQMVQKELADKERDKRIAIANETAQKAIETTEAIKEAVRPVFDNWREEINSKFKRIQHYCEVPFNVLRTEMYAELEHRAGCDLNIRLRNLKRRLQECGSTKTEINNCRKIDVIEKDKKLREIFSKIVSEYEIKYCS